MEIDDVRPLATDAVIIDGGEVLVLQRDHDPYEGQWVLPGGLVEPDETARTACAREVREEVGLEVSVGGLVGLYDDPDRDDRGNVSVAFRCRPQKGIAEAREEARQVSWFYPEELPAMGFDHARIVADAYDGDDSAHCLQ